MISLSERCKKYQDLFDINNVKNKSHLQKLLLLQFQKVDLLENIGKELSNKDKSNESSLIALSQKDDDLKFIVGKCVDTMNIMLLRDIIKNCYDNPETGDYVFTNIKDMLCICKDVDFLVDEIDLIIYNIENTFFIKLVYVLYKKNYFTRNSVVDKYFREGIAHDAINLRNIELFKFLLNNDVKFGLEELTLAKQLGINIQTILKWCGNNIEFQYTLPKNYIIPEELKMYGSTEYLLECDDEDFIKAQYRYMIWYLVSSGIIDNKKDLNHFIKNHKRFYKKYFHIKRKPIKEL